MNKSYRDPYDEFSGTIGTMLSTFLGNEEWGCYDVTIDEEDRKFIAACNLEANPYLHTRNPIRTFTDLPTNKREEIIKYIKDRHGLEVYEVIKVMTCQEHGAIITYKIEYNCVDDYRPCFLTFKKLKNYIESDLCMLNVMEITKIKILEKPTIYVTIKF